MTITEQDYCPLTGDGPPPPPEDGTWICGRCAGYYVVRDGRRKKPGILDPHPCCTCPSAS